MGGRERGKTDIEGRGKTDIEGRGKTDIEGRGKTDIEGREGQEETPEERDFQWGKLNVREGKREEGRGREGA